MANQHVSQHLNSSLHSDLPFGRDDAFGAGAARSRSMTRSRSRAGLLVLGPESNRPVVTSAAPDDNGRYRVPLWDLMTGRLEGAWLIRPDGTTMIISDIRVRGVGLAHMQAQAKVALWGGLRGTLNLDEIKSLVWELVGRNPRAYPHKSRLRARRLITCARSLDGIIAALRRER
jgi:hypothetical protein